ncbi:NUDIX hydrolase domain-like protein [Gongronella butleri]|nr:NUDIX hydrolase domain-like protein [Gongronella butleri]
MSGQVQVGLGNLIRHKFGDEYKFLFAKRKGSHGAGKWSLAGGHLEFGETFASCAERETLEETNLAISEWRAVHTTNDIMADENKHYVTVFMLATVDNVAGVRTMEPEKVDGDWHWLTWTEMKQLGDQLFLPVAHLIKDADASPQLRTQLLE